MEAALYMGSCSSSESDDSRKRSLDEDVENGVTKKLHYAGANEKHNMKLLVPRVAAGAIIGTGGENITLLQECADARIRMSHAHEFYPGTSERICLITGDVFAIMAALMFVMETIQEKTDLIAKQAIDFHNKNAAKRVIQVKILVPDSTAGIIIGRSGSYIRRIRDESGSYIFISPKAKDLFLQERCITVTGDMESNKRACYMILDKIVQDPLSGTCLNISYADVSVPVGNNNPSGSPYTYHNIQRTPMHTALNSTANINASVPSVGGMLKNGGGLNLSLNQGTPPGGSPPPIPLLEHLKGTLRKNDFSDLTKKEVTTAIARLHRFATLGMDLGLLAGYGKTFSGSLMGSARFPQTANGMGNNRGGFGPTGIMSRRHSSSHMPRGYNGSAPGCNVDCFCQKH